MLWASPNHLSTARRARQDEDAVYTRPVSLELGFTADAFDYLVDLGIPQSAGQNSAFTRDLEIKREAVFAEPMLRISTTFVRRTQNVAKASADIGLFHRAMTVLAV